jgi:hypothetical protein
VVGGGVLLAAVLGLVVFLLVRVAGPPAYNAQFQPLIKESLGVKAEERGLGAYIRGKMLLIKHYAPEDTSLPFQDVVDDEVFPAIPRELRATRPADVGTVVVLRWSARPVGHYPGANGGATAMAHTCDVQVIDRSLSAIVTTQSFVGGEPPASVVSGRGHSFYGTKPVQEIAKYLVGLPREPAAGGTPAARWTVLFRSDDPAVWNTDSPGAKFAVPVRHAHPAVKFLRLKRLDTGEVVIAPISLKQLTREDKPESPGGFWWNGTAQNQWGGRHLGLAQALPALKGERGPIGVSNHNWFTGSGFGHKLGVDDRQYYCWRGTEIPKTAFEIAVTAAPLTRDEERWLVK